MFPSEPLISRGGTANSEHTNWIALRPWLVLRWIQEEQKGNKSYAVCNDRRVEKILLEWKTVGPHNFVP